MPSALFAALALQAGAAADAVTAEAWTLLPMAAATEKAAGLVPDPSRAGVGLLGTFTEREAKPEANAYDVRQKHRPGVIAAAPAVIVSTAALDSAAAVAAATAGLPFAIRQGDGLLRAADGRRWRIASVYPLPSGTLRLAVDLLG